MARAWRRLRACAAVPLGCRQTFGVNLDASEFVLTWGGVVSLGLISREASCHVVPWRHRPKSPPTFMRT